MEAQSPEGTLQSHRLLKQSLVAGATPVIPQPRRLWKEDHKSEISLSSLARS